MGLRFRPWLIAGFAMLSVAAATHATGLPPEAVLEQVSRTRRAEVQEIVIDPTFVRTLSLKAAADSQVFACLLDHPDINAPLSRRFGIALHRLVRVGPGRYQGDDGAGNSGTLEVLGAEVDRRIFMERGVSPDWWFGDIAGRVVAVVAFSSHGNHLRGDVEVWARIDQGMVDRLIRILSPVLGGFLDRKLHEQFGVTFRVAERAALEPDRFCAVLAGLPDGSPEERDALAGLAGCTARVAADPSAAPCGARQRHGSPRPGVAAADRDAADPAMPFRRTGSSPKGPALSNVVQAPSNPGRSKSARGVSSDWNCARYWARESSPPLACRLLLRLTRERMDGPFPYGTDEEDGR